MKLIVGLGNFGKEYDYTYHNVGFMTIQKIADKQGLDFSKKECKAKTCSFLLGGEKIILAEPQTYMNLSGESILELKDKYKLKNSDIYVFCDDIDLPLGKIRLRHEGSGGTHNGLRNIVENIGQDFNRIKIGIGRDTKFENLADFVLSKIPQDKFDVLNESMLNATLMLEKELGISGNWQDTKKIKNTWKDVRMCWK